jgi:hypothetical protein
MKSKIIILGLIGVMAIPQVVSAAWWNPFSWKVFKRASAPKVEMVQTATTVAGIATSTEEKSELEKLRAEVEELKNNQKNQTVNSTPTTKASNPPASAASTKSSAKQDINYNALAITSYNSGIELSGMQIELLELISSDADRYIEGIPSLVNKAKSGAQMFPEDSEFWNLVAEIYSEHRTNISNLKQTTINYISVVKNHQNQLRSKATEAQYKNISLSEAEAIKNTVYSDLDKIESSVDAMKKSYSSLTSSFLDDKDAVSEALEVKMSSLQSAISELESQKRSVPTYSYPTRTNCFFYTYSGGGNMNCYSY